MQHWVSGRRYCHTRISQNRGDYKSTKEHSESTIANAIVFVEKEHSDDKNIQGLWQERMKMKAQEMLYISKWGRNTVISYDFISVFG